jgi:NADPH2:quinone reductase
VEQQRMRAIAITAPGGPEVLRLTEVECPQPGAGELLIRVSASGVNRPDVLQRAGLYPAPAGASPLPGLAQAGLARGDRVCALVHGGGYAEYCVAPVGQCLPVPPGWSDVEAASLPEACFTVWSNVFDRGRLQAGETLLVHGGSSGIGVTAIQMAKAFGACVIVTVGSDEKAHACLALGADHAINYRSQDFVQTVAELTAKRGVDVILDMVVGDYMARNIECLAEDGRLVIIAVQGGSKAQFNAAKLMMRRLTVTGSTLRPRTLAYKAQMGQQLRQHVWPLMESGTIRPVIHGVFPAVQVGEAHAVMESSRHIGKETNETQAHSR